MTKDGTSVYLKVNDANEYTLWQAALEKSLKINISSYIPSGGKKMDDRYHLAAITLPRICTVPLHLWGCEDVATWLSIIPVMQDDKKTTLGECQLLYSQQGTISLNLIIEKNNVNGETIKRMKDKKDMLDFFTQIGIQEPGIRNSLTDHMSQLNEHGFTYEQFKSLVVYKKLSGQQNFKDWSISDILIESKQYCDLDIIKEKIRPLIIKEDECDENTMYRFYPQLLLTTMTGSESGVLNAINAAATKISGGNALGLMHTGLALHNCLIEWTRWELALVRPLGNKLAVMCSPTRIEGRRYFTRKKSELNTFISSIAEHIIDWNVHYSYGLMTHVWQTKLTGNCQMFTMQLFKKLNLPISLPSSVGM